MVFYNGEMRSADNRRLACLKEAWGGQGSVEVDYYENPKDYDGDQNAPGLFASKCSSVNGGTTVVVVHRGHRRGIQETYDGAV